MENFSFQNPTKIIFGRGTENEAGNETKHFSRKILLHYGSGSIKKSGLFDRVTKSLEGAGIRVQELPGVKPNPRLSLVRRGIELCREEGINFILAVGGGSVIDSAKAIAAGVPHNGDVWDLFAGKAEIKKALSVGGIVTIAAAGSEASNGAVVTKEDGLYKRAIVSELLRPKFAILNPELTFTLPPYQTACGAADIMAHVMERYFTQVPHVDLTDRLCEATLKTMIKSTPVVLEDPENYDARAEIMWAGTVAHNDLLGTGRIPDWGAHMIEHELSAIYDVPHGAGLTVVFPAWMQYVYKRNMDRLAQYAARVWDVEQDLESTERTLLEGIRRTSHFFKEIGLPVTLGELNVPDDRLEEMAAKCTEGGPIGNFMKLEKDDVLNIFKLAR